MSCNFIDKSAMLNSEKNAQLVQIDRKVTAVKKTLQPWNVKKNLNIINKSHIQWVYVQ